MATSKDCGCAHSHPASVPSHPCRRSPYVAERRRAVEAPKPHPHPKVLDAFTRGYIYAALWSSIDGQDEPLDRRFTIEDIDAETLRAMKHDAVKFQRENAALIDEAQRLSHRYDDSRAGHDFWLTRNGHGVGFWDRDLGDVGDKLTKAAKKYGEFDLYVGDDGMIYGSPLFGHPAVANEADEAGGKLRWGTRLNPGELRRALEVHDYLTGKKVYLHPGSSYSDAEADALMTKWRKLLHIPGLTAHEIYISMNSWGMTGREETLGGEARETVPVIYEAGAQKGAEDYIAVNSSGRKVAGPFKNYDEAKRIADQQGGVVKYAFEAPGAPHGASHEARDDSHGLQEAREAAEAPDGCLPWVKVARDPERYESCLARAQKLGPIQTPEAIYNLLAPTMEKEDAEIFVVVLLDIRFQLRGVAEVARGQRSRVGVGVNDVMRIVLISGAEHFCCAHSHPSGKANPSQADRDLTKAIEAATEPYGNEITFLDHCVLGTNEYFSIRENKLYKVKRRGKR